MIFLVIVIALSVGFVIGRGSVNITKGGKITTEVTPAGTTRYSLEVDMDIDDIPKKKYILFRVVPRQESLL